MAVSNGMAPNVVQAKILAEADLAELRLDGDVAGFHRAVLRLRDHYAS